MEGPKPNLESSLIKMDLRKWILSANINFLIFGGEQQNKMIIVDEDDSTTALKYFQIALKGKETITTTTQSALRVARLAQM